jgi:hypothetical protein
LRIDPSSLGSASHTEKKQCNREKTQDMAKLSHFVPPGKDLL